MLTMWKMLLKSGIRMIVPRSSTGFDSSPSNTPANIAIKYGNKLPYFAITSNILYLSLFFSQNVKETLTYPHIVFSKRSGLRYVIDKLFEKCGGYPQIAYSMEEDQGVAGLVGAGFGVAVVPRMPILSSMSVSIIEIATPSWERLFYMATLKNVYQAPVVTNFKNYVLEHAEL